MNPHRTIFGTGKRSILAAAAILAAVTVSAGYRQSVQVNTVDGVRYVNRAGEDEMNRSSFWNIEQGEPPISVFQAAALATEALNSELPDIAKTHRLTSICLNIGKDTNDWSTYTVTFTGSQPGTSSMLSVWVLMDKTVLVPKAEEDSLH